MMCDGEISRDDDLNPLVAQGEVEVDIHIVRIAIALIEEAGLLEQCAPERHALSINDLNLSLLALGKVAQILGAQTTRPRNAHFSVRQRLFQRREDVACKLDGALQEQNVTPATLFQRDVIRLGYSHCARCAQEVQARLLIAKGFSPEIDAIARGIVDQQNLNSARVRATQNALHAATYLIGAILRQNNNGKCACVRLIEQ